MIVGSILASPMDEKSPVTAEELVSPPSPTSPDYRSKSPKSPKSPTASKEGAFSSFKKRLSTHGSSRPKTLAVDGETADSEIQKYIEVPLSMKNRFLKVLNI